MRVTPANLLRIARETVQQQVHSEPGLVAAYLTGSLRSGDPLIGGAADIDIVYVHNKPTSIRREIIPLNPEIHLDIVHNPLSDYDRPKMLRVHPWLGPELYDPKLLYESQHFFEFVQAGVRDKYNEPENMLQRSQNLAAEARQKWSSLQLSDAGDPEWMLSYLSCLFLAANAVAMLSGGYLSERRLLLEFPAKAEAAGLTGMAESLFHLCGAGSADAGVLTGFLPDWGNAFVAAGSIPTVDKRVTIPRLRYYRLAFETMLAEGNPQAILWPLMLTWTLSITSLPGNWTERWHSTCAALGMDGDALDEKMDSLDHFLDSLEQALEDRAGGQATGSSHI